MTQNKAKKAKIVVLSGQPCGHPGCLNHVSHPCEGCGRIAGQGHATVDRDVVANDQAEGGDISAANGDTLQRLVRLSSDDWSEVGDVLEQCIAAADIDESYARHVRDKAMAMMVRMRNEAVDNGLRKKANKESTRKEMT